MLDAQTSKQEGVGGRPRTLKTNHVHVDGNIRQKKKEAEEGIVTYRRFLDANSQNGLNAQSHATYNHRGDANRAKHNTGGRSHAHLGKKESHQLCVRGQRQEFRELVTQNTLANDPAFLSGQVKFPGGTANFKYGGKWCRHSVSEGGVLKRSAGSSKSLP